MSTFNVPITLPGTLLKKESEVQFGLWTLEGNGNLYVKKLGLHWVKSAQPRTPIKCNAAMPALWVGLWSGDGSHTLGSAGAPLFWTGLEGQGFSGSMPYTLHDIWGADSFYASIINNTTNLSIFCNVTGVADWVTAEPISTLSGTQTTASTSTAITVEPDQIIV